MSAPVTPLPPGHVTKVADPSVVAITAPPTCCAPPARHERPAEKRGLSDDEDEEDEDDAGSLVDFVIDDDDGEIGDGTEEDADSVLSDLPATKEEAIAREMEGIDAANIVTGKRTRRQTQFYEKEVFGTEEYRNMMLDDVPPEEMRAAIEGDEGEEEEEEEKEDEDYEGDEDDEDEDDEDEDDEDEEDEEVNVEEP